MSTHKQPRHLMHTDLSPATRKGTNKYFQIEDLDMSIPKNEDIELPHNLSSERMD